MTKRASKIGNESADQRQTSPWREEGSGKHIHDQGHNSYIAEVRRSSYDVRVPGDQPVDMSGTVTGCRILSAGPWG
jgi:hypothetical protein